MRKVFALMVLCAVGLSFNANAHVKLLKSNPENETVLKSAPQKLSLELTQVAKIMKITLTGDNGINHEISDLPSGMVNKLEASLPDLTTGSYVIEWRAVSKDMHPIAGKITFIIEE